MILVRPLEHNTCRHINTLPSLILVALILERDFALLLNLVATVHMRRIRSYLTLHAAVPIDVTSAAPLGTDADLIGTGYIGARLGRPIAARALKRQLVLAKIWIVTQHRFNHRSHRKIVQTRNARGAAAPRSMATNDGIGRRFS